MEIKNKNCNWRILIIALLSCVFVNVIIYYFILGGYLGADLNGHWSICAYTLKGYDPYPLIGEVGPIAEFPKIYLGFSAVPWGCTLGNVFYPGFLSLQTAHVYNFIAHFIALFVTAIAVCKFYKEYSNKRGFVLILLVLCAHFSFMYSLYYGNAGAIICLMLIMSIFLAEKHPYISGVMLALAMSKPQIAAIVCIIYLLNKNWRTLFTAAIIDVFFWILTSLIVKTSPLVLLAETFSSGTASVKQYLGLFSALQYIGIDKILVLAMNVLVGLGYTVGLWYYMCKVKKVDKNSLVLYAPACIASTFWIYKNGTDYLILAFAAIFLCELFVKGVMSVKDRWISFLCIGYLEMSRCAVYVGLIVAEDNNMLRDLIKGLEGLLLALVGIVVCKLWVKYTTNQEKNQNV